ncbi:MAG: hypothetical protein AAF546_01050 [Verrucomicrobiota bacterium]
MTFRFPRNTLKLICLIVASTLFGNAEEAFAQSVSLDEALDAANLDWRVTGGTISFEGQVNDSGIGGDVAQAILQSGEVAEISTTLPGPGVIDFWIAGGQFLDWQALLDGVPLDLSDGYWPYGFPVDGIGTHVFTLRYSSSSTEEEAVFADGVIFQQEATVSLEEALDAPGLVWTSPDAAKWLGVPYFFSGDGEDSAWIGGLEDEERSSLKTTITGPAEVSFWWQTTRGSYTDGELLVNGVVFESLRAPSQDFWKQVRFAVGAGNHVIEFRATGQTPWLESHVRGMWLDQVEVTPLDDGRLSSFGNVLEGAWLRGASSIIVDGQDDDSSLGVLLQNNEGAQLSWPLPASEQLRLIRFYHKNASSDWVSFNGSSASFDSDSEWVETQLRVTPGEASRLRIELENDDDLKLVQLDDFAVTELSPMPIEEALGWIGSEVVTNGFYGWPGSESEAFATEYGASLSFSVSGPGRLTFEAQGGSRFQVFVNSLEFYNGFGDETGEYELLIPGGDSEIVIQKSGFGSCLGISALNFESLINSTYGEVLGVPEMSFASSGTYYDQEAEETRDFVGETFIALDGEVLSSAPPGANFVLETEVEGPALFSFERRVTNGVPETQGWVSPQSVIIISPIPVFEVGTSLSVNGVKTLVEESNFFFSGYTEPEEPMNPSQPGSVGGDLFGSGTVSLARDVDTDENGWKRFELYLGSGHHTLQWRVQKSRDASVPLAIQLANFQVKPVRQAYHDWAASQWQADDGVDNAATWMAAWQDPMGDPDRDGFYSAYEYAFLTNPRSSLSHPPSGRMEGREAFWPMPSSGSPPVEWKYWLTHDLVSWSQEGLLNEEISGETRSRLLESSNKAFFRREVSVAIDE